MAASIAWASRGRDGAVQAAHIAGALASTAGNHGSLLTCASSAASGGFAVAMNSRGWLSQG